MKTPSPLAAGLFAFLGAITMLAWIIHLFFLGPILAVEPMEEIGQRLFAFPTIFVPIILLIAALIIDERVEPNAAGNYSEKPKKEEK